MSTSLHAHRPQSTIPHVIQRNQCTVHGIKVIIQLDAFAQDLTGIAAVHLHLPDCLKFIYIAGSNNSVGMVV